MLEAVTLSWATGELLISPFGLTDTDSERLDTAGFTLDWTLDLYVAPWSITREALALEVYRLPDVSHDPSPFALVAGRRAEGIRRRLAALEQATGRTHEELVRSHWYCQGEPARLWWRQHELLRQVRCHQAPRAAAARCRDLVQTLADLGDARDEATCRLRWFASERLRFERGEMDSDPLPC